MEDPVATACCKKGHDYTVTHTQSGRHNYGDSGAETTSNTNTVTNTQSPSPRVPPQKRHDALVAETTDRPVSPRRH